jgi:hypothetical protein
VPDSRDDDFLAATASTSVALGLRTVKFWLLAFSWCDGFKRWHPFVLRFDTLEQAKEAAKNYVAPDYACGTVFGPFTQKTPI